MGRLLQVAPTPVEKKLWHPDPGVGSDEPFWIGATKVEALFGLGRKDEARQFQAEIVERERERLRKADGDSKRASEEGNGRSAAWTS